MSLLRRTNNNANNNNNQQNNQNNNAANNNNQQNNQNNQRSGLRSRFGNNQNNNNNQQNNQNNSRFGNSRFNRNNNNTVVTWTIKPTVAQPVRFQFDGLGDPLHRLLGTLLKVEYGNPADVARALQDDEQLRAQLMDVLEDAWIGYDFNGAALMYPWHQNMKQALSSPLLPVQGVPGNSNNNQNNNQNQQNNQNQDDEYYYDDDEESQNQGGTLRAIDMAFVLNVLARTRSNVLVANTPLALEAEFLSKVVVSDDPRIVALARATGCLEEAWSQ